MSDGVGTTLGRRLWERLPEHLDRRVTVAAWASLVAQVLIVATGGAVRLTSSGLGCPTWPLCTSDSLVSTPEMGIHGLIEFGNRTLTGLVGGLAVVVLLLVVRARPARPDLVTLAGTVVLGVVAQALVGGVTVLTGLNPFVVGFHYVASLALVCVCAAFLVRLGRGGEQPGATSPPTAVAAEHSTGRPPRWFVQATWAMAAVAGVTVVLGVLTTGAGPHSGDPQAGRNGFDAELLQHVHAWPSYALVTLTVLLVGASWVRRLPSRRWFAALLLVQVAQVLLGLYQARNGLPVVAVGAHMVLAALLAGATTVAVLRAAAPAEPRSPDGPPPGAPAEDDAPHEEAGRRAPARG